MPGTSYISSHQFSPCIGHLNSPGFQPSVPKSHRAGWQGGGRPGAHLSPDREHHPRRLPLHQPGTIWEGQTHLLVPDGFSGKAISHSEASPEPKSCCLCLFWTVLLLKGSAATLFGSPWWCEEGSGSQREVVTWQLPRRSGCIGLVFSCQPEKQIHAVLSSPSQVLYRPPRYYQEVFWRESQS